MKPISKSKRQLAQLLIEAGVTQFPEGANWAAQDKCDGNCADRAVSFFGGKHKPKWFGRLGKMWKCAVPDTTFLGYDVSVALPTLIPNWHQTVLSRAEFDQIVAEAVVTPGNIAEKIDIERVEKYLVANAIDQVATPTLDQLLQDWRNADDYAQRKQTEADEAAAMRDERWQAVQARAGEMGVTVGWCEPVVVITDWRDLQVGDIVWWSGDSKFSSGEYTVYDLEELDHTGPCVILLDVGGCKQWVDHEAEEWRFIRRP